MPILINATEETVTVQACGNYFTFKPGQEKTIRNAEIANFIQTERRGSGLAILPDLLTAEEDTGDVEITAELLEERRASRVDSRKEACSLALRDYVNRLRGVIKNNQVSLKRDASAKGFPEGFESHEMSDGEFEAMKLVAKYDSKGKDASQDRLNEIEKLKKQIRK